MKYWVSVVVVAFCAGACSSPPAVSPAASPDDGVLGPIVMLNADVIEGTYMISFESVAKQEEAHASGLRIEGGTLIISRDLTFEMRYGLRYQNMDKEIPLRFAGSVEIDARTVVLRVLEDNGHVGSGRVVRLHASPNAKVLKGEDLVYTRTGTR